MRWTVLVVAAFVVVAGCGGPPMAAQDPPSTPGPGDAPMVTVVDADTGVEHGSVAVAVAATRGERYTGLSTRESLSADEGMLFVHERAGSRAYVMRSMAFPIDIIYVGADRNITSIHHATVPDGDGPLTRYEGHGKWVLEVSLNWTAAHNVSVGDRVRIPAAGE
ncbi:DUF192 domain-containing protein [Halobacterium salinarum]|uniref:DUF192 domain-containing protein n=1 Tax=Halobacterium salinarum TaxID=2242 RepID=UPI001F33A301|nr:DUF192 domain-containing protein [Halobacterium salinarum]